MKKLVFCILLAIAMGNKPTVCQADPIEVEVGLQIADPNGTYPFPRGPVLLPTVYIDGNTLSFEDLFGWHVLQIIQDDTVVYSTLVPAGVSSVILPSNLSGDCEFRLVADTYYYYGYISL